MSERINLSKAAPDLYAAVRELDNRVSALAADTGLAEGFVHPLRLRVSQVNQCAFCMRLHARDALKLGESADRLAVLSAWREAGSYFNDKEAASLELAEAVTLITEGQVPDAVYVRASQALSDDEILAVEWLAVTMNAWNRIALSSRYPVHP